MVRFQSSLTFSGRLVVGGVTCAVQVRVLAVEVLVLAFELRLTGLLDRNRLTRSFGCIGGGGAVGLILLLGIVGGLGARLLGICGFGGLGRNFAVLGGGLAEERICLLGGCGSLGGMVGVGVGMLVVVGVVVGVLEGRGCFGL